MTQVTLKTIYDAIQDFRGEVKDTYVTKDEFGPVRMIAFGLVGTILTGVLIAVLTTVVKAQ